MTCGCRGNGVVLSVLLVAACDGPNVLLLGPSLALHVSQRPSGFGRALRSAMVPR